MGPQSTTQEQDLQAVQEMSKLGVVVTVATVHIDVDAWQQQYDQAHQKNGS